MTMHAIRGSIATQAQEAVALPTTGGIGHGRLVKFDAVAEALTCTCGAVACVLAFRIVTGLTRAVASESLATD